MSRQRQSTRLTLVRDGLIIGVSLILALALAHSRGVPLALQHVRDLAWWGSLVAGVLYSSIFTVAPATVMLGGLARQAPLWEVAIFGGLGAMLGDLVVFRLAQSAISHRLARLHQARRRRRERPMASRLRWPLIITGAVIIASPLPDEIGLALMGLSHLPKRWFLPLALGLNAVGIFFIGVVARNL